MVNVGCATLTWYGVAATTAELATT